MFICNKRVILKFYIDDGDNQASMIQQEEILNKKKDYLKKL